MNMKNKYNLSKQEPKKTKRVKFSLGYFGIGKINGKTAVISPEKDYDINDNIVVERYILKAPR